MIRLATRQLGYEWRAFWRNPPAAVFTFAFPLFFLLVFGGFFDEPGARAFFVPAIVAFSLVGACFTNVAMGVTFARDRGLLKRVRATPLPMRAYLAGRIGMAVLVALLLTAIVAAVGALLYDVPVPWARIGLVAAALGAGAASLSALALAMTAAIPNADAAPAVVNAVVLPLLFVSDVFIPADRAPGWVRAVGESFPIRHLSDALQGAWGAGRFEWTDVLIVLAWGAVGALLAARFFSWEPRR